jgi:hypothetical protein
MHLTIRKYCTYLYGGNGHGHGRAVALLVFGAVTVTMRWLPKKNRHIEKNPKKSEKNQGSVLELPLV